MTAVSVVIVPTLAVQLDDRRVPTALDTRDTRQPVTKQHGLRQTSSTTC